MRLIELDPWDSLQSVYKRPKGIVCLSLPFKLLCSHSYLILWCKLYSSEVKHIRIFNKGNCTSCLFWGDGLTMSLDPPKFVFTMWWWPSLWGRVPLLSANGFLHKPFHSTSLQPLILKGFDKSPQLNIK